MKRMKALFSIVFILILVLAYSCHESSKDRFKTIVIEPSSASEGYLSSYFDSIFYIPLVTSDSAVIGSIKKIEFYKDIIFITDGISNKVYVFSIDGKYILSVGKNGRGPGEFNKISEAAFDTLLKRVMVFDFDLKKELAYDFSGNFLAEKENNWWISECLFLDSSRCLIKRSNSLSADNEGNTVYKINLVKNGQRIKGFFPYDESPATTTYDLSRVFTTTYNNIYIGQLYNDTIYIFKQESVIPEFIVKYTSSGIPVYILRKKNSEIGEELWQTKTYAYGHQIIAENDFEIFLTFIYKNRQHFCFYLKNSGETRIYSSLTNDIDGGIFKIPLKTNLQGYVVSVIYPNELKEVCEKNYNHITGIELKEICDKIQISDNPVLMCSRMRF